VSERARGLIVAAFVVLALAAVALFLMAGRTAFAADPVYDGSAVKTVTATLQDGSGGIRILTIVL